MEVALLTFAVVIVLIRCVSLRYLLTQYRDSLGDTDPPDDYLV